MRNTQVGNYYIEYPEQIVWLNDKTTLKVSTSDDNLGVKVTVITPDGGTRDMEYHSEMTELYFILDDCLKALFNENLSPWTVQVTMFDEGIPIEQFAFQMNVFPGTSFTTRTHGSAPIINIYNLDELTKLQIFTPYDSTITIGQTSQTAYAGIAQLNLSSIITQEGEYQICLRSANALPPVAYIVNDIYKTPLTHNLVWEAIVSEEPNVTFGGDIWTQDSKIFPICYTLKYQDHCDDYNFVELKYYDTDGCVRYLGGRAIEEVDNSKDESYNTTNTDVWNIAPHRWREENSKTIKIGFSNIDRESAPKDIMYSNQIWVRSLSSGEWENCNIKSTSFKTNKDEIFDFEIEITTHKG